MSKIVSFELYAANPARAAKFYTELFGWTAKEWFGPGEEITPEATDDENRYWILNTEPEKLTDAYAEMLPKAGPTIPAINGVILFRKGPQPTGFEQVTSFICTISVDSLDESIKRALALGGQIVSPKKAVRAVGWLAYVRDTEGNVFGMLQPEADAG